MTMKTMKLVFLRGGTPYNAFSIYGFTSKARPFRSKVRSFYFSHIIIHGAFLADFRPLNRTFMCPFGKRTQLLRNFGGIALLKASIFDFLTRTDRASDI